MSRGPEAGSHHIIYPFTAGCEAQRDHAGEAGAIVVVGCMRHGGNCWQVNLDERRLTATVDVFFFFLLREPCQIVPVSGG